MIRSKKDLDLFLETDKIALARKGKRPSRYDLVWRFEILLRKCEYYKNCKSGLFNKLIYFYLRRKMEKLAVLCGFSIPLNCFDMGLSIAHRGTIVVNTSARIGKNCRLHIDVNIGTQAGYGEVCPQLGDNVYIGPGAKLFGDIQIANNIVIGANAVVNKSFTESDISIGGIPAKKISDKGRLHLGPLEDEKYQKLQKLFQ